MSEANERSLAEAVQDAIAAFDAANLTWGQFYQHSWAGQAEEERLRAEPVRQALGDAALSVPAENDPAAVAGFVAALRTAHDRALAFIDGLPASEAEELSQVPAGLIEAVDTLAPFHG